MSKSALHTCRRVTGRLLCLLLCLATLLPLAVSASGVFALAEESDAAEEYPPDPNDPDNIAYGKPTRANAGQDSAHKAVNGNTSDFWVGVDYPKYVDVDLMDNYAVNKITVYMPTSTGKSYQYVVYTSLDGVNFERAAKSELTKPTAKGDEWTFETPIECRVVRVNVIANSGGSSASSNIAEIKVYGEKTETEVTPTRETMTFTSYEEWLKENEGVDISTLKDADGVYDIADTYDSEDTVEALQGLITRILGSEYVDWFTFKIAENPSGTGYDYFRLEDADGKVCITGNEGVSLAMGLNHYLKYFCYVEVSQQTSNVKMPEKQPAVGEAVFRETSFEVRYAYNYCTLSYTMPFFGYDDWQRELDYLMLSGVNLILDITATEALFVMYLQQYGYSAYDALDFVCGYSYKAWWLMGNLYGYGGNVSDTWVYDTLEMARHNQRYMTVMGAQPCLQTFVGNLPVNFGEKAAATLADLGYGDPTEYMTGTGDWCGFTRPYVINTTYEGYDRLAADFYATQSYLYGQVTDYYAGDFFHEINITPPAVFNKPQMSADTLAALMRSDEDAVWILQAWWENPLKEVLDGFGNYRADHIIVLDLAAVASPKWSNTSTWGGIEFGGTGWVYCMLDNYGGRTGLHGNLKKMAKNIAAARSRAEHMKGIGITPEGTQQNPVVFELFWETAWSNEEIDVEQWLVDFVHRRYGEASDSSVKAWTSLADNYNLYGVNTADGTSVNWAINNNATLNEGANEGGYFEPSYREATFETSVALLMQDYEKFKENECYIYDLVTLFQQQLSCRTNTYIQEMKDAIALKDFDTFAAYSEKLLGAMALIDEIASYDKDLLFGTWIGRAEAWCEDDRTGTYDDYSQDMMKLNAKALVTMWASRPITNYAYRQYHGLQADYYNVMWTELCANVSRQLMRGASPTTELAGARCFEIAWGIVTSDKEYTTTVSNPLGDENARGLKAIYEEIRSQYLSSTKVTVLPTDLTFKEGSAYAVDGKRINGVEEGTTVATLKAAMAEMNGTVTVTAKDGTVLSDSDTLPLGCSVSLIHDGMGLETSTAKIYEYALSEEDKAALRTEMNEFLTEMEEKVPTAEWKEAVDELVAEVNAALEADFEDVDVEELRADIQALRTDAQFEEVPKETPVLLFVVIGIGAVVVIGVLVTVIAVIRRKGKKK